MLFKFADFGNAWRISMKENILEVKNLNVYYTNKVSIFKKSKSESIQHVLKDVSFNMKKGEILGLVGESGRICQ